MPARPALPLLLTLVGLGGLAGTASAQNQPPTPGKIYSCVDASGRRLSSDRPIPECLSQEQRLLGKDGSTRGALPPLVSREEAERLEQLQKQRAQEQSQQNDAARRDRALLLKYPDSNTHDIARIRALAPVQKLIDAARLRLGALEAESKSLTNERAALGFKAVPEELKQRTNMNDGALEAQRNILHNHEVERERVNQQFDTERSRLLLLWAGMAPGTPDEAPITDKIRSTPPAKPGR